VIIIVAIYKNSIDWNRPEIVLSGLTLILFGSLFFVVNPLLSMQMDWDLFSMPGPVFIVFVAVIVKVSGINFQLNPCLTGSSLSLVILTIPFYMVHATTNSLSYRLESAGIRIYKTYYEWSNQTIKYAIEISDESDDIKRDRKRNVLQKLEPYAIPEKDHEYARLLVSEGEQVLREDNDPAKALEIFNKVSYYDPTDKNNLLYRLEAHFLLGEMNEAYQLSLKLVEMRYPDERKARRIAIHTALEAGLYEEAYQHSFEYSEKWPDDQIIQEILVRLKTGQNVKELKNLFIRSN
jgi:tetratricopeptide (TPR) repeat protein